MNTLKMNTCRDIKRIHWPESDESVSLFTSAIRVMTDFEHVRPLIIEATANAVEAEHLMQKTHVPLRIVVNGQGEFIGLISLTDLNDEAIVRMVANGYSRNEIQVLDFMQKRENLPALEYNDVRNSTISRVVNSLATCDDKHILVVNRVDGSLQGILSASEIVRKLNLDMPAKVPVTFTNVSRVLKGLEIQRVERISA